VDHRRVLDRGDRLDRLSQICCTGSDRANSQSQSLVEATATCLDGLVQLTDRLQKLCARPTQSVTIGLQASQYSHVSLLDDASAKSLHVATARFIATLAIALSHRDGWR
jgi:hypothetical protein